jgi:HK97 family phage portal protein
VWPFRRREDRSFTLEQLLADEQPNTTAGATVTTETAQRLSVVWACIRLIVDAISTMPVDCFRVDSRDPVEPKPSILVTPAAGTTMIDWLAMLLRSVLTSGDTWGLIVDRAGITARPTQIELVAPHRVVVSVNGDRAVVYRLDGREVPRDDLWHFRGYPTPGQITGLSPIAYQAQTIGLALAAEKFGAQFFGDGATPSGVLTSDQRLTRDQAKEMSDAWHQAIGSRGGAHRKTAVFGSGTKWEAVSIAPEESQFLETQRFTVQQIARIYGIPPECIGADSGNSMTYSNIETRDLTLLKYAINPWLVRLETALTELVPRGQYVKFNAGALLRTDLKTRYEAHAIGINAGFLTVDEARELEDREPLPGTVERPSLGVVA